MQSAYHNCPTIDGVMQAAGREYAAGNLSYAAGGPTSEFQLNLEKAYPKEAGLKTWRRSLRLDRGKNEVAVTDTYALDKAAKVITLTLMTPCKVTQEGAGRLSLENRVKVLYDAGAFTPAVEEIKLEDGRLKGSWGERIYRILLKAQNPALTGTWTTRIAQ
jgi:hypothetical protein